MFDINRLLPASACALSLVAVLPMSSATASPFSYTYVQGGYTTYSVDDLDDLNGLQARASYALSPNTFIFGGLQSLSNELDYDALHAGWGYRWDVRDDTDVWIGGTLEYQEVEIFRATLDAQGNVITQSTSSDDDIAPGVRGGVRYDFDGPWGVAAEARVVTGDFDYSGYTLEGSYAFTENLSVRAHYDRFGNLFNDINGFHIGIRYDF